MSPVFRSRFLVSSGDTYAYIVSFEHAAEVRGCPRPAAWPSSWVATSRKSNAPEPTGSPIVQS